MAVFDTTKGKMVSYVFFILIIGVGIFFITKRHFKKEKKDKTIKNNKKNSKSEKSKNKWLLSKRGWFR